MTIDEAIRIKGLTGDEFLRADPDDVDEADEMSVEALKLVKRLQAEQPSVSLLKLPGQTEE